MGIMKLAEIAHAKKKKLHRKISPTFIDVPKGHFAVYVGDSNTRFVVPISYLNHPLFQELLHWAEQEFGPQHQTGALTIPCTQDYFLGLTALISSSDF